MLYIVAEPSKTHNFHAKVQRTSKKDLILSLLQSFLRRGNKAQIEIPTCQS